MGSGEGAALMMIPGAALEAARGGVERRAAKDELHKASAEACNTTQNVDSASSMNPFPLFAASQQAESSREGQEGWR